MRLDALLKSEMEICKIASLYLTPAMCQLIWTTKPTLSGELGPEGLLMVNPLIEGAVPDQRAALRAGGP